MMMMMAQLITGGKAFAQTNAEYNAAISALGDGGPSRRITTTIEGVRYYVTTSGTLTASVADAGSFDFEKVSGGTFKTYGYKIKNGSTRFTNAPIENDHAVLHVSNLSTTTELDRSDWEAQVLFLKDGKYAIRACNTADGTSGWNDCGRVFWTTNGTTACYSYEPAYIWEVEGLGTDAEYNAAMAAITDGGIYYMTTEVDGVTYYLTKDGLLTNDTKDPNLGQFIFNKNTASGFYKSAGFVLESGTGNYFSNPANSTYTDDIITDTKLNLNSGARDGWEVQVFFMNADGKYAVRSTNCTPASSGWNHVGSAFWTVAIGDSSPYPTYEYEPKFIWNLVSPADAEAIEDGQTVRLVHGGKSVFVENSSLDVNKKAVLWTETNVNAQRWTLTAKADGTFLLTNDYTGFYLASLGTVSSGTVGQTNKSAAGSKGSWEFEPVEGAAGQYRIYLCQDTNRKSVLVAPEDNADGGKLSVVKLTDAESLDPARLIWTVHAVKPMERAFTKDKRDDMMEKWKARAYRQAGTGCVIGGGGWWGDAEMFEIVLDALETTGDQQYAEMFENLYTNFIARNKDTWYQSGVNGYNPYNDDIAWMCIACVRAYLLTGVTKYRETAKKNFDGMFARADCYGNDLLQWLHGSGQGTNSCINGPAAVCACYLAMALSDDSYYQKARKTYMAERGKLFEMSNGKPTGAVWDSYDIGSGNYNKWCSTYNQGTNLGAAIMLYNRYGEQMFKDDADAIISWSESNLSNDKGIIHVCQTVRGDLTNFKGIMLRYLRMYAETFNAPSHYAWIAKNAYHAWNNRNSAGITSSAWLTKAEENFKHQESEELKDFSHEGDMTCVSAAFNCHLGVVDSHNAYAMNQAEDFNFVRNAPVTYDGGTDDGGGMVGPMKSDNYIGYRRVNFGNKPASHIALRTNITLGSTGINVFLDYPDSKKGTLLCSIKGNELSALKTWDTISKMIKQPVTGTHDVYFVSTGTGLTNINWWQFQSLNPDYGTFLADLTGISTIIASDGSDTSALIDNKGTTYATISGEKPYWDIYTPIPVRVLGFSLLNADDAECDPQNVTLYAYDENGAETKLSNKALTFPDRSDRLTYTISTTKQFKRFRLQVNESAGASVRLADFELYGTAIAEAEDPNFLAPVSVDATAVGLSNTELIGRLNDGNRTTYYHAAFTEPVSIIFNYSQPVGINAYGITASKSEPTRDPADWTLEGSNDGNTWTKIDTRSGETFSGRYATQFYTVETTKAFTTFRFTVTATGGADQIQIGELQLLSLKKIDPTGISEMHDQQFTNHNNYAVYNLAGQRISRMQKGINIIKQGSAKANVKKILR